MRLFLKAVLGVAARRGRTRSWGPSERCRRVTERARKVQGRCVAGRAPQKPGSRGT